MGFGSCCREPVCYNRPNLRIANNLLKNKIFILAQTRPTRSGDAPRSLRRWLVWAGLPALAAFTAIVIAAQMNPDAKSRMVIQELLPPMVLTSPAATGEGTEYWGEEKIVRGDTVGDVLARLTDDEGNLIEATEVWHLD